MISRGGNGSAREREGGVRYCSEIARAAMVHGSFDDDTEVDVVTR